MNAREFRDRLNAAKSINTRDPDKDTTKRQQLVSSLRVEALDSIYKNGDTISRHLAKEILDSLKA